MIIFYYNVAVKNHLVKIFIVWVFLFDVSWQQHIYWEHVAVAANRWKQSLGVLSYSSILCRHWVVVWGDYQHYPHQKQWLHHQLPWGSTWIDPREWWSHGVVAVASWIYFLRVVFIFFLAEFVDCWKIVSNGGTRVGPTSVLRPPSRFHRSIAAIITVAVECEERSPGEAAVPDIRSPTNNTNTNRINFTINAPVIDI